MPYILKKNKYYITKWFTQMNIQVVWLLLNASVLQLNKADCCSLRWYMQIFLRLITGAVNCFSAVVSKHHYLFNYFDRPQEDICKELTVQIENYFS